MIFQNKKNIGAITKITYLEGFNSPEILRDRIKKLDLRITEVNKSIFQAQIVRIRSLFPIQSNLIVGIQRKIVEKSASNSLLWHQKLIVELITERDLVQEQLDRITGKYWSKRFKSILRRFLIFALFLLLTFIFIVGIFAAIYMIPFLHLLGFNLFFFSKMQFKNSKFN